MGKFAEALKAKLATLGKAKVGSLQDFVKDPQKELEQLYLENDEFFVKNAISKMMEETLGKLSPEKQQEINGKNLPDEEKWAAVAEAWEAQAGEEAAALAAQEMEGIVSPDDPRYPKEKLLVNRFQAEIDALRAEIKPEDPEAQAKRELLDKVDRDLTLASDEALDHYNRMDELLQYRLEGLQYTEVNAFVDTYQGGKYASKLPKMHSDHIGIDHYTFDNVAPFNSSFKASDSGSLVGTIPEFLSPEMKKDVLEITDKMRAHSEEYHVPGATVLTDKTPSGRPYYLAEQGTKAYAFWPLQTAYQKLAEAVDSKDYDKIREAERHYSEMRALTDGMMQTMGKYKTPLCGGNVNSTRSQNGRTAVPQEQLKDFVSHSKLNGLYMLHGFYKNTGITAEEFFKDPAAAMRKSARLFISREGVQTKPTLGSKLFNGMSTVFANQVSRAYFDTDLSLIGRAFESMSSMEKDPEKRSHIAGCGGLAAAAGSIVVNEYFHKIEKISQMPKDKTDYFYQHVALLPKEEIDPVKLYDKLNVENWKKDADPRRLAQELRTQGKLDYSELAERTNQVLEEVQKEMESDDAVVVSSFNREKFYQSSMKAYGELIRTATPEEKQDPGFQKFRDSVFAMKMKYGKNGTEKDVTKATATCRKLDEEIALQRQKKTGWFISSKNTDEHNRMTIAQRKLQYKVRQLRGEDITDLPPDEIAALKATDLKKLVDKARSETYRYCCMKSDNGKDFKFVHSAGINRFNTAYNTLKTIDEIADTCGILSPGEKLLHKARREMMHDRDDKGWTRENVEDYAAKAILGMSLAHGKKSFEEQAKYEDAEKQQAAIDKIKADPAFRRMMANEGALNIADKIITGNSSLTDAYIKAKDQVAIENRQTENEAAHNGIRELGEGEVPEAMTNDDKKKMWGDNPIQL